MASIRPRATARPSPTPSPAGTSPSRWNGSKIASSASAGTPGPRSTTRRLTRGPDAVLVQADTDTAMAAASVCLSAFSTTLAITRSSRPGSADTGGRSSGAVTAIDSAPGTARRVHSATVARSTSALREVMLPVCSRLMSSRFATRASNRSADSSTVASSSSRSSSDQAMAVLRRLEEAALIAASGRAQIVRDRGQQRGLGPVALGQLLGPDRVRLRPATLLQDGEVGGVRGQQALVGGLQRPAPEHQG